MADSYTRDPGSYSMAEQLLVAVPPERRHEAITEFVRGLPADRAAVLPWTWSFWRRPAQVPPDKFQTWVIRAGRGFGKTRTGAEAVREYVREGRAGRISLIAPTAGDCRDVMIEGESGLLSIHPPDFRPVYEPSKRRLTWPNGAVATAFSAEEPDRLRGPQSDLVWGDEPASWKTGSEAWDNAMMGNRLGRDPRSILTGTPRPLAWLRDIEAKSGTVVSTGSTYENITNLAETFIELVLGRYEGTRLGQQELHALYMDDVEGALWRMAVIEATRLLKWNPASPWSSLVTGITEASRAALGLGAFSLNKGDLSRSWETWVGVDPPGETAECGIVIGMAPKGGKAGRDHAVILDDMSTAGSPEVWGSRVVEAVRKHNAMGAIVESNQGGDMVRSTIHAVDPDVRVEKVRAAVSKSDRAEPVSVLYAKGWVHHWGHLAALESQMTTWVPEESKGKSPDRLDALVHLVTALLRPQSLKSGKASVHVPGGSRGRTTRQSPRRPGPRRPGT